MSMTTIQELGLGVIEERPDQAPYTEYLSVTYPEAIEQVAPLGQADRVRLGHRARRMAVISEKVIRELDVEDVYGVSMDPAERREKTVDAVMEWSEMLGSFNGMADGQSDLLRAAGILLESNVDPAKGEFGYATAADPRSSYKAFTSLMNNNEVAAQMPNGTLLHAAELVHTAAWADKDSQRRERLLGMAADMYEHVSGAPYLRPYVRRLAENLLSDIAFHQLSVRGRKAKAAGDLRAQSEIEDEVDARIRDDARKLYNRTMRASCEGVIDGGEAGKVFEDFITLALRQTILTEGLTDYEVRHAFEHEDHSVPGVRVKDSFDVVVQRYEADDIEATPVQLKTGSRKDKYLPGIAYVTANDLPQTALSRATLALAKGTHGRTKSGAESRALIKRFEGSLLERLLAS